MSRPTPPNQTDLFAPLPPSAARRARLPENLARPVRRAIWRALVESSRPLLITGYSSLEQILSFLSERLRTLDLEGAGRVRLLMGQEPRLVPASSLSLSRPITLRVPDGVAAHGAGTGRWRGGAFHCTGRSPGRPRRSTARVDRRAGAA